MEVVVGTYEQVLVGFNVVGGEDELEVTYKRLKFNTEKPFLLKFYYFFCTYSSSTG